MSKANDRLNAAFQGHDRIEREGGMRWRSMSVPARVDGPCAASSRGRAAVTVLCLLVVGCADLVTTERLFDLTFSGDSSFQGSHGGQVVRMAVPGIITAQDTVSVGGPRAFRFTCPAGTARHF